MNLGERERKYFGSGEESWRGEAGDGYDQDTLHIHMKFSIN